MTSFEPACLPTSVGSLPHTNTQHAWDLILRCFPEIPAWPQLPRRTFLENMYVQFSEGFPGATLSADRIYIDRAEVDAGLERLYTAYLENDFDSMGVSQDHAAGLARLVSLSAQLTSAVAIKGQVTGPISLGLQLTDRDRRSILYDEVLADSLVRHLYLKAAWQEKVLRTQCAQTIIFVDEPYLSTFGSAYVPLERDDVVAYLEGVLDGLNGLKGIHCCGNTDWAMLLSTSIDIISFDAYQYALPFSLYADAVKDFLGRKGMIAWGIVPNDPRSLDRETPESLMQKLLEAMNYLAQKSISKDLILSQSLITPACGLGTLTLESAIKACELTSAVSRLMREQYLN